MHNKRYINKPIDLYAHFSFVDWESAIYPKLVGQIHDKEVEFVSNLIIKNDSRNILDLALGGGTFTNAILKNLHRLNYTNIHCEANEIDTKFITQATKYFKKNNQLIPIHQANRLDLSSAIPAYDKIFDFCFLLGNSLTYLMGKSREEATQIQKVAMNNFAKKMAPGGILLLDTRDYDYIEKLRKNTHEEIIEQYSFDYTTMYHGVGENIVVVPAYISDTLVTIHYYDIQNHLWSKLDLYPIYHQDMLDILEDDFIIEEVFYDFERYEKDKCILRQYLARRK